MLPIRCYTCNKVLGNLEIPLEQFIKKNENPLEPRILHQRSLKNICLMEFYDHHMIRRYCCKRILLTAVADMNITCDLNHERKLPITVERLSRDEDVVTIINCI